MSLLNESTTSEFIETPEVLIPQEINLPEKVTEPEKPTIRNIWRLMKGDAKKATVANALITGIITAVITANPFLGIGSGGLAFFQSLINDVKYYGLLNPEKTVGSGKDNLKELITS